MKRVSVFRNLLVISILILSACETARQPLYESSQFAVFTDRVEQGEFVAKAISDTHMISNYQSPASGFFSPEIEFKFSINGKDNEMAANINHQAVIGSETGEELVLEVVFGQKANLRENGNAEISLPANTRVKFRVDMRDVLASFKERGFYEDVNGEKIFTADFKGIFVAGSAAPLSWDFANLYHNEPCQLHDADGDGFYEVDLVFNASGSEKQLSSEWKLASDLSIYPTFHSTSVLVDALYNLSLEEMKLNIEADSTFRTGKEWAGVWTRDISYSVVLAMAFLEPEIAMKSLMRKVKNNRIIQDTGTGGAWPVSSDRVVWSMAAWEIYKFTGDRNWLMTAFEVVRNSVNDDKLTIVDDATGLIRGESSFLDWREQTYPRWMEPVDIYSSLNLGTNAAHYQTLKILGLMAREMGEDDVYSNQADQLKANINHYFWLPEKKYYSQYLYGRNNLSASPRAEALGESFCMLFDIADQERKQLLMQHIPIIDFGIPCIYPQIPNLSPYHNNGIWPFVQAFHILAAAKEGHSQWVNFGLATIMRPAALFLTNKENFVAESGDFAGTVINSDRQLWSVAGMLAMHYRVLLGMSFEPDGILFQPVIPKSFGGIQQLNNFKYRGATFSVKVNGYGTRIQSFKVDGVETKDNKVMARLTGSHSIEIDMNNEEDQRSAILSPFVTAPETPVLSLASQQLSWTKIDNAISYVVYQNAKEWKRVTDVNCEVPDDKNFSEYQVLAVDAAGVESFLSNPVVLSRKTMLIEAENFNRQGESHFKGYTGMGYVVFDKLINDEFRFKVNLPEEGVYQVKFRYANGNGPVNTENKCGIRSLYHNGNFVGSVVFPQRGRDEWSNWGYSNGLNMTLKAGPHEFNLKFDAFNENMNGEVNNFLLDCIEVVKTR